MTLDERIQRGVVGRLQHALQQFKLGLLGLQHFGRDAVGLQDRFDQRLEVEELLWLQQVRLAFFRRQIIHHGRGQFADHALLVGFFDIQCHRNEEQRQLFGRIVIQEGRGQRAGVLADGTRKRIEPVSQQLGLELRLFANVDDLPDLDGDRLTAKRAGD